jgi:hypothetical protein
MDDGGSPRNQIREHPDEYSLGSIEKKMCLESLKGKTLFIYLPSPPSLSELSEVLERTRFLTTSFSEEPLSSQEDSIRVD